MTFAAFTSAMIIRQGSSYDWQHFTLPAVLYFDTAVLLASSVTLELARKRVAAYQHGTQTQRLVGSGFSVADLAHWDWFSSAANTVLGCSCDRKGSILQPIRAVRSSIYSPCCTPCTSSADWQG